MNFMGECAYFSFEVGEILPEKIESQRNAQMFKDGCLRNDTLGLECWY